MQFFIHKELERIAFSLKKQQQQKIKNFQYQQNCMNYKSYIELQN